MIPYEEEIIEMWAVVAWPIICLAASYYKLDSAVIIACLTYLPTLRWIKSKEV